MHNATCYFKHFVFNADFWDGFRWSYQRMKDNTYKMKDDAYKTLVIKTR